MYIYKKQKTMIVTFYCSEEDRRDLEKFQQKAEKEKKSYSSLIIQFIKDYANSK